MINTAIVVTFFDNLAARSCRREALSIGELADRIVPAEAATKETLPMLKLGSFGDVRSENGSLRHTANLLSRSGVELDYDAEKIDPGTAAAVLEEHGIAAIIYTSPQHLLNSHGPRWRILAPFEREHTAAESIRYIERIAGLFRTEDGTRTVLAAESWSASQAYFYGRIEDNPAHAVTTTEGRFIDHPMHAELDRTALPNPGRLYRPGEEATIAEPGLEPLAAIEDIEAALAAIPNNGPANWHWWTKIGMASWAASGGSDEGLAAWREWSSRNPSFDSDATAERWQHFHRSPPTRSGYGTLVFWAREHDPEFRAPSWDAPPDIGEGPGEPEAAEGATDTPAAKTPAQARPQRPVEEPWPVMGAAAFHGPAGEIVQRIAPLIEADPVAILAQLLTAFGNLIGRDSFVQIGPTRHHARLFITLAGRTAVDRKGTALGYVRCIMERVDRHWRSHSGLTSGEGLVHAVRDPIYGFNKKGEPKLRDAGVEDKRLLVAEPEFSAVLVVMQRQFNTLSPKLRQAWDGDTLQGLGKTSPETATEPHISLITHITTEEYCNLLDRISMANGFANRFCTFLIRRTNVIPLPDPLDDELVDEFAEILRAAMREAGFREIQLNDEAKRLWDKLYRNELTVPQPGLFGHLVARAAPHVIRLSLIYALLDGAAVITLAHIKAGMAVWRYCEASTRLIFGDMLGDPIADELLKVLRQCAPAGMTRTEISHLFYNNYTRERIGKALALLLKHGKARFTRQRGTRGAPTETWFAV
jgi:hypothetical protein